MSRKKQQANDKNKTKLIIKGSNSRFLKNDVKVQFKLPKKHPLYKKLKQQPVFPTFNMDNNFFTPTFILKQTDQITEQTYRELHKRKVEESLVQFDQELIMMAKPRSKNKYCGVCRSYYEEYLQHTKSPEHLQNIKQSNFHKNIESLCQQFQSKNIFNESFQIQKTASLQTKIGDQENSTQSIIDDKSCKEFISSILESKVQ